MKTLLRILGIWMFSVCAWSNLAFSEVMVYGASGKSIATYASIQAGIDACPAGGKVSVSSGTYNEALLITKGITVIGAGDAQTTISAQGLNNKNTVTFVGADTGGAMIKGFKVTGAKGPGFAGPNKAGVNYGNGITPLEYGIEIKNKLLLTELLNKGVTPSVIEQDMIDKILISDSSSSTKSSRLSSRLSSRTSTRSSRTSTRSSRTRSSSTPSDLSSISLSSLDLFDRGSNHDTPPPPLERISSDSKNDLIGIASLNLNPSRPQRRKLRRKSSKKSSG